jgi:hypothetical protein
MLYRLRTDESLKMQYEYAQKWKGGIFPVQAFRILTDWKFQFADLTAIFQLVLWLIANIRLSHWFSMMLRVYLRKEIGMRLVSIDQHIFPVLILGYINYLIFREEGKLNYWLLGFGGFYFLLMLDDFIRSQKNVTKVHTSYPGTSIIYDNGIAKLTGRSSALHLWIWILLEPLICFGFGALVFFYLDTSFGILLGISSVALLLKEIQNWFVNLHKFTNIDESEKDKRIFQSYYDDQRKQEDLKEDKKRKAKKNEDDDEAIII